MKSTQFQSSKFDPISYLNQKFPDQQSLNGLQDQIQKLNKQLNDVNKQLIDQIHEHAMMNIQISQEIQKAKQLSKQIINQVGIIKEKAKKSQEIVYDMCKDLKSLDIAKKNLTFSIDALKKFIMMVDALQKLRDACQQKQYQMIANLLSAFNQLSKYFKKYQQIPQIQSLYKEKASIVQQLFKLIIEDFQSFQKGTNTLTSQQMSHATKVIEVLGQNYWRKFGQSINEIILKQYKQQYGSAQNAVLQNTERRFGFIKRKMQQFNDKFGKIIPLQWGMDCLLLYQFCSITRIHITQTLQRTSNINVAILMKSLEYSIKFQQKITKLMTTKYSQIVKRQNKNKYDLQSLPKFSGSISNSFQRYLNPYVKSQQQALAQALMKSLDQDRLTQLKIFNSALVLFHGVKNSVKRASSYSKGNLIIEILGVVKKMFRIYSEKCFQKSKKNLQIFEQNICWIINTAQYCKNIIQGVKQIFDSQIDPAFADNIQFANQEGIFSTLISKSIQTLISSVQVKIQASLSQIAKVQWDKIEDFSDVSPYIKQVKQILKNNYLKIKQQMQSTYLTLYINKIVSLASNKFIQNLYKCKKIPFTGYQVLRMDVTQIKQTLLSLIKNDQKTYAKPKAKQNFTNFLTKIFTKPQNIIKLLQLPDKQFAQSYEKLMQNSTLQDLQKILQVRGTKKNDFTGLVKSIQNKNN